MRYGAVGRDLQAKAVAFNGFQWLSMAFHIASCTTGSTLTPPRSDIGSSQTQAIGQQRFWQHIETGPAAFSPTVSVPTIGSTSSRNIQQSPAVRVVATCRLSANVRRVVRRHRCGTDR